MTCYCDTLLVYFILCLCYIFIIYCVYVCIFYNIYFTECVSGCVSFLIYLESVILFIIPISPYLLHEFFFFPILFFSHETVRVGTVKRRMIDTRETLQRVELTQGKRSRHFTFLIINLHSITTTFLVCFIGPVVKDYILYRYCFITLSFLPTLPPFDTFVNLWYFVKN